jgi:hypothetical protein
MLYRGALVGLLKEGIHPVLVADVLSLYRGNYLDLHEVYIATTLCRSRPLRPWYNTGYLPSAWLHRSSG